MAHTLPSGGTSAFMAHEAPDAALAKPRAPSLTLTRMQLANRINGAAKAKRLALMLTTKKL